MSDAAKRKHSWMYACLKGLGVAAFHTVLPVVYHHLENLPEKGPYIIIGNHQSWIDPVVMAVPIKEQVSLVGKRELSIGGMLTKIMARMHVILINRHGTDMEAMRACMKVVKEGNILGIFPEGTRHHKGMMEELESGVAMIALRAGVPLIPTLIPTRMRLFRRNHCYFGAPIPLDDIREKGINTESCQELLERITAAYGELIRQADMK